MRSRAATAAGLSSPGAGGLVSAGWICGEVAMRCRQGASASGGESTRERGGARRGGGRAGSIQLGMGERGAPGRGGGGAGGGPAGGDRCGGGGRGGRRAQ